MAKEDGTSFQEVSCTIGGKSFQFGEKEINEALGLKVEGHDAEATDKQMVDFLTLIQYANKIDTAKLNKKYVRREWSFLFDALQKVFLCRKTGWDQISHIAVKLAYSLAYNQEINVGAIILKELAQRLGRTVRGRGNDIFYPCFLQCILNYLDANVHELEGIDKNKMAYSKTHLNPIHLISPYTMNFPGQGRLRLKKLHSLTLAFLSHPVTLLQTPL
ncbi:hypothetical protein POM88_040699 [Heracleum sosnowskyi]|uniref:Uncharacterized protein n=1 Tax=Heracleum sosnowskyi TaxID=360622 RepID=A0AAD8HEJ4_9APIA|nr:hypothetical protein POM88_040699 [Heracleum sosnowskyi]